MDLATALKAIELVGHATPAAMQLYEGFIAVASGSDEETLVLRYVEARRLSDDLHRELQARFGAGSAAKA